eukprot:310524-Rhodomonas_salina.3
MGKRGREESKMQDSAQVPLRPPLRFSDSSLWPARARAGAGLIVGGRKCALGFSSRAGWRGGSVCAWFLLGSVGNVASLLASSVHVRGVA